ncbi:hypothetical protein GOP47_0002228 [Adiantum capillus-veneris]|uniref:RNA 3'-terminal-phosphate cyclase (ATP) n=1 Tax=Adiantum capillus-veneris TaxID=13818 RepID=A0A9D4V9S0_ADICA|nr:hypothetical protein GOP47_0002228 [Adiantum capillus-veneris]
MGKRLLQIDGSFGEGGGQVLRTALSLAAITGQAIRIFNIRAGRKKPGLAAQHLTSVRAAASICSASISGDTLNSTCLEFRPSSTVMPGTYSFNVGDGRAGGSAGAASLVLQTVLLPLAIVEGSSTVHVIGGTHVPFSPPISYLEHVYLPVLRNMGLNVTLDLHTWGWNPKGGGSIEVRIVGNPNLQGLKLLERGELKMVRVIAATTKLPDEIKTRMGSDAESSLLGHGFDKSLVDVKGLTCPGLASGRGLFIFPEYAHSTAGFSSLAHGAKVAKEACSDMIAFHESGAPVDEHLGDQIMLPACLAMQESEYVVSNITLHQTTNAWVIELFGLAEVVVNEDSKKVSIIPKGRIAQR